MKELDIKVGYRCNNSCVFCLNKDKRYFKEFPIKDLKNQINNSAKDGCEKLVISGGEPTISEHFFNLIRLARQKGIKNIEVQTNGRAFYYEGFVKKINRFRPITFLVSFHFPNLELYKKYSKSNGFCQVVKGIKNLVRYQQNLTVNTVIMKPNLPYLKWMVGFLKKIGVTKIQYRFIDGKNVMDHYKDFVPRHGEAVPIIQEIIKKNPDINIGVNEIPICILGEEFLNNLAPSSNPERENLSIGNKVFTSPQIMKHQFIFPNCEACIYRINCKGIRKEYYQFYGAKDLKPIKRFIYDKARWKH